jgi:hypothetical protein
VFKLIEDTPDIILGAIAGALIMSIFTAPAFAITITYIAVFSCLAQWLHSKKVIRAYAIKCFVATTLFFWFVLKYGWHVPVGGMFGLIHVWLLCLFIMGWYWGELCFKFGKNLRAKMIVFNFGELASELEKKRMKEKEAGKDDEDATIDARDEGERMDLRYPEDKRDN